MYDLAMPQGNAKTWTFTRPLAIWDAGSLWQLPPVMVIFWACSPSFCLHVLPSEKSLPDSVWLELWILLVRSSMASHTWPPEPLATGSALWKALMENSWWVARSIYLLVYLLHDCMDTRMPPHFGDGPRWHKGLKQIWVWDGVGQSRDTQWLLILRKDFKSFQIWCFFAVAATLHRCRGWPAIASGAAGMATKSWLPSAETSSSGGGHTLCLKSCLRDFERGKRSGSWQVTVC